VNPSAVSSRQASIRRQATAGSSSAVREPPACRVAAAVHRGSYAGLAVAQAALERWVAANGLPVTGRLRILYLQFGAELELRVPPAYVVERDVDFVTELQLELH
jgi:effector-binding domain-containing protein